MKKILVTGGTGLVGSSISIGTKISSKFDLRISSEVDKMFLQYMPTHVVHCAAKVGGLGSNMNYKGEFFYDNIMMNTNIIEACRKFNVKKLICLLSTCIFPAKAEYPLTMNQIHDGKPHETNYAYAYSKRMVDVQLRAYNEQYGLNYTYVVPCSIYGPNDNFNLKNGHVVPSLIHQCYLAKKNNTTFNVWGTGTPLREFIYSEDVGKIIEWMIDKYEDSEPFILTTSTENSIEEIAKLIAKYMKFDGKIEFDSSKPDGQFRKPSDNTKLKTLLPNFEFTPLDLGIQKSVNWFVENYDKARK